MRFRLKWNRYRRVWQLQTPPCTSSAWDTVATSRFKWPLQIRAWWIATDERIENERARRHRTVEFDA